MENHTYSILFWNCIIGIAEENIFHLQTWTAMRKNRGQRVHSNQLGGDWGCIQITLEWPVILTNRRCKLPHLPHKYPEITVLTSSRSPAEKDSLWGGSLAGVDISPGSRTRSSALNKKQKNNFSLSISIFQAILHLRWCIIMLRGTRSIGWNEWRRVPETRDLMRIITIESYTSTADREPKYNQRRFYK